MALNAQSGQGAETDFRGESPARPGIVHGLHTGEIVSGWQLHLVPVPMAGIARSGKAPGPGDFICLRGNDIPSARCGPDADIVSQSSYGGVIVRCGLPLECGDPGVRRNAESRRGDGGELRTPPTFRQSSEKY